MEKESNSKYNTQTLFSRVIKKYAAAITGVFFILMSLFIVNNIPVKYSRMIWSDAEAYYDYLPYTFIKKDIAHMHYAVPLPGGNRLNKVTMGVAMMELPFFLAAHAYSKIQDLGADGYSFPYQVALLISISVYMFLGLFVLFKILRPRFEKKTAFFTVAALFFASNLYYYTFCEPGLSHGYSFFMLTLFLFRLDYFIKNPNIKNTLLCGIPLAWATLIRPTNILYVILFLLYEVYSVRQLKERLSFIGKNLRYFFIFLILGILFYIPQIMYWSYVWGKLKIYGYVAADMQPETFAYLTSPKIFKVLFGVESGWLVYTPFFIFFFIGLIITLVKKLHHSFAILIIFLLILYLNASWWSYTFACSFGYRSLIEFYPLFAFPVAFLFSRIFASRHIILKTTMMLLIVVFSFFNIRISGFYYKDPCWEVPQWTWNHYRKIIIKAFYIQPDLKLKEWRE
ncbi:MAG TPA: hypothetical protein PLI16_09250 [Bacteroidales bacterium]|nr:hypothetical protein [Bacteroidales bacterium]